MMKPTLCSRCNKNVAVIFITKIENGRTTNEGLCLVCAKELGVMPVDDIMKRFGVTEDDLEAFSEHLSAGSEPEEGGFEEGGTPTFPNLFGNLFNLFYRCRTLSLISCVLPWFQY